MKTVCDTDLCAGCMACVDICNFDAIKIIDSVHSYNAAIDSEKCIGCGACEKVCQQLHPASFHEVIKWQQGWSCDPAERASSSSGGAAASISRSFIEQGGVVCSCIFSSGQFVFKVAASLDELQSFKGSKYVKSSPHSSYSTVKSYLRQGTKVLFIGLPCQVSAMRNYCRDDQLLYTIDLICHGTPSPKVLEYYLNEHGKRLNKCADLRFRAKTRIYIADETGSIDETGVLDNYSVAFLRALSYTENCYSCSYARRERVSDITLGDAWGSDLVAESEAGISLVTYQTSKGRELLEMSCMKLVEISSDIACDNNEQLVRPSKMPKQRRRFMSAIEKGKSFDSTVRFLAFDVVVKQDIKRVIAKLESALHF